MRSAVVIGLFVVSTLGCTGGTVAVFREAGQLSPVAQRDWLEFQRDSRAAYDPQIQTCLAAPTPDVAEGTSEEFATRVQRTYENAGRALGECKAEVGAYSLKDQLRLALEFAPEGHTLAAGVLESHTETDEDAFNQCVRRRFCFLKAWPGEHTSRGVVAFNTNALP